VLFEVVLRLSIVTMISGKAVIKPSATLATAVLPTAGAPILNDVLESLHLTMSI
jgi:hypothetical protein